jgi:hypothetical protein
MSCHWPSPRLQSAAQRVLDRAERRVAAAPEGSRHEARLKASYLVGGYLASTDLSHDEALARLTTVALANTDDAREARRDIADGLTAGQSRPIITPPTRRRRGDWHGRAITPYEDPPWRK